MIKETQKGLLGRVKKIRERYPFLAAKYNIFVLQRYVPYYLE